MQQHLKDYRMFKTLPSPPTSSSIIFKTTEYDAKTKDQIENEVGFADDCESPWSLRPRWREEAQAREEKKKKRFENPDFQIRCEES